MTFTGSTAEAKARAYDNAVKGGVAPERAAIFAAHRAEQHELEAAERFASQRLIAVKGVGSGRMGLTPDSVKESPEYRNAKAAHDAAFRNLQNFNTVFVHNFAAEMRAERVGRFAESSLVEGKAVLK